MDRSDETGSIMRLFGVTVLLLFRQATTGKTESAPSEL